MDEKQALVSEQILLGAILLDSTHSRDLALALKASDFIRPENRNIATTLRKLVSEGLALDLDTVISLTIEQDRKVYVDPQYIRDLQTYGHGSPKDMDILRVHLKRLRENSLRENILRSRHREVHLKGSISKYGRDTTITARIHPN